MDFTTLLYGGYIKLKENKINRPERIKTKITYSTNIKCPLKKILST